jgi:hypothetical protein
MIDAEDRADDDTPELQNRSVTIRAAKRWQSTLS